MPFQPGNKLASLQRGCPKRKTQAWDNLGVYLIAEGAPSVIEIMRNLKKEDQKEFLRAFKDILEYFKPKLARSETDVTSKGKEISVVQLPLK